jgi:hypothetical protein
VGAGVFAEIGAENFHDGRVVAGGVDGEAFQGVDAVELVVAELWPWCSGR